jgi:hypothetical protein
MSSRAAPGNIIEITWGNPSHVLAQQGRAQGTAASFDVVREKLRAL